MSTKSIKEKRKRWQKSEVEYLKNNYKTTSIEEISNNLKRSVDSIRIKSSKLHISKMPTYNENFFKEWSEEMSYILGYWFADGCIGKYNNSYRFSIGSNDLDIINKIQKCMESTHKIIKTKQKDSIINDRLVHTNKIHNTLSITSKIIYNDIINLGGNERKSLTAKFPYIPKKYIRHFIRGYFDGDGNINLGDRKYPHICYVGSKYFIDKLILYIGKPQSYTNKNKIWRIDYWGIDAKKILDYMYKNSNIHLDRKYNIYKQIENWNIVQKNWSDEEIQYIINNKSKSIKELASNLDRTWSAVWHKVYRLNGGN